MTIRTLLEHISIWIILVPLFTGSWLIKKLSRDSFIVLVLVIVATPPQLLTAFFRLDVATLNIFYNVYTPCEFLVLFILFKKKFLSRKNNRAFIVSSFIYVAASLYFIFSYNLTTFVSLWTAVNNIIYICWVLMYVAEVFFFDEEKISSGFPFTYFMLGIFFYSQCSVLLFVLYYYIGQSYILGNTWIIQSISNIIMYLLFAAGFIVDARSKSPKFITRDKRFACIA
ncbi:MAG: hypothetical protein QM791_12945 [Ferruginibacter sp.]